jgi:hypothetical protein
MRMNLRRNAYQTLVFLFFVLQASVLRAEVGMSLGVEYFSLGEHLQDQGDLVDEAGPRYMMGVHWHQDRHEGWIGRYEGELYTGNVDYDGQTQLGEPFQATTQYLGTSHEGSLARAWALQNHHRIEVRGSLGLEWFRRSIVNGGGGDQKEDFQILFTRLGLGYSAPPLHGFSVDGGIKYPVRVQENAHLESLGLASNPTLRPKGRMSLYASMEYRFYRELRLRLYYDSYRFDTSDAVTALAETTIGTCTAGSLCSIIQPETRIDRLGIALRTAF